MSRKRQRSESVGVSLNRKKLRRKDENDNNDNDSDANDNTVSEAALLKSPRFTASQTTCHTQREAGIIEEIQVVNFMSHSKLSFQYVFIVRIASLVRNVC